MRLPRFAPLVLVPLALAGCASQRALTAQSESAQSGLDRVEQSLRRADDTSRTRQDATDRELAAVRVALRGLEDRLARLQAEQDRLAQNGRETDARAVAGERALAERLTRVEARLAELSGLPERTAQLERRLEGVTASSDEALALARQEQIRTHGKEAFTVLLTEDKTLYPLNSPELGNQDVAKLDDLAARLVGLGQEYHLEIQGHTDNIGTEDYNYALGMARAEVVKRYLHERRGIPLGQMSVISFGAASPVDRDSHRNRRILIRVLVLK